MHPGDVRHSSSCAQGVAICQSGFGTGFSFRFPPSVRKVNTSLPRPAPLYRFPHRSQELWSTRQPEPTQAPVSVCAWSLRHIQITARTTPCRPKWRFWWVHSALGEVHSRPWTAVLGPVSRRNSSAVHSVPCATSRRRQEAKLCALPATVRGAPGVPGFTRTSVDPVHCKSVEWSPPRTRAPSEPIVPSVRCVRYRCLCVQVNSRRRKEYASPQRDPVAHWSVRRQPSGR